jgi:hypothetical protein
MTTEALLEKEAWSELLQVRDFTEDELARLELLLSRKEAEAREKGLRLSKERESLEREKQKLHDNEQKAVEYQKLHDRRRVQFEDLDHLNEELSTELTRQQRERDKLCSHRAVTHGPEKPMAGPTFDKMMSIVKREPKEPPLTSLEREDLQDLFLCAWRKNEKGEEEVVTEQFIPSDFLL